MLSEFEQTPRKLLCKAVQFIFESVSSFVQDEECLLPGEATDLTFLEKMEEKIGGHPHFVTSVTHLYSGEHVKANIEVAKKEAEKDSVPSRSPTAINLQTKRPGKHWREGTSAFCTMPERSPTVLWVRH